MPGATALPFSRLVVWRAKRNQQRSRIREISQSLTDAVIRVYDEAGNVIETHEHAGEFQTQSTFHPRAQRNAFRRRGAHRQSRSFARWNRSLRHSSHASF